MNCMGSPKTPLVCFRLAESDSETHGKYNLSVSIRYRSTRKCSKDEDIMRGARKQFQSWLRRPALQKYLNNVIFSIQKNSQGENRANKARLKMSTTEKSRLKWLQEAFLRYFSEEIIK